MLRSISEKHSAAAISLNLSFKSKTLTARRPDWSKSSQEPRSEGKSLIGLADDDVIRFSSAIGRWIDDVAVQIAVNGYRSPDVRGCGGEKVHRSAWCSPSRRSP